MGVRYTSGKIAEEMLRKLSYIILYKLKITLNSKIISLTKVDLASDNKTAKIYVSVIEGKDVGKEVVRKLNSIKRIISKMLLKNMYLKRIPALNFVYDESIEKSVRMNKILNEIVPTYMDE